MTKIKHYVYRKVFSYLILHKSAESIPRSGSEGEAVNCFTLWINKDGKPYFHVDNIEGDELIGKEWDGHQLLTGKRITLSETFILEVEITHYYGLRELRYESVWDFVFNRITAWPYIKIILYDFD